MSPENPQNPQQQPGMPEGVTSARVIDVNPTEAVALSSPAFWGEDAPDFQTLATQDPAAAYDRVRQVKANTVEQVDRFLPPVGEIVEPEQIIVTMTRQPGFFASLRGHKKPTTETVSRFVLNPPKGDTQE